ncbi:NAD(P)-dependent dehydrogenase (short-subunit alcohol dehydrogenase family) [Nocardia transvalensis]|uniref:NAD(P)-dependent dehydrogenase (Short-subunit alcohol dehydrogenase family) n=1 Tax=Nocardia transvalensis TaxID=37333 RepID=A0A7W9PL63_9NOCA|nr:SDR family oxidoreductase [Nocardia transvalensis]MBB5918221.1 NAD(P)-dependent dehydrogenase (short-subunit alcohol dehydrogenase family) [Nocardia transvalensis]
MASRRNPVSLTGQVAVVTGGARGIGRATARAFLAAGARVALGDIDGDLVARTAAELGDGVVGLPVDVTDPASFAAFLEAVEQEFGEFDILVNNAGIMPSGLFADEDPAMTERILDINVRGVMTGTRLALRRFQPRGRGHLINIASLAGTAGMPGLATYCASKHAVIGFTEAVHLELAGTGIQVTAVLPGNVRTELSAGANMPAWALKATTIEPEDVATAVVAALGRNRPLITVPRALAPVIRASSLLPYRIRRITSDLSGMTKAFTQPDPEARAHYHRRIADLH